MYAQQSITSKPYKLRFISLSRHITPPTVMTTYLLITYLCQHLQGRYVNFWGGNKTNTIQCKIWLFYVLLWPEVRKHRLLQLTQWGIINTWKILAEYFWTLEVMYCLKLEKHKVGYFRSLLFTCWPYMFVHRYGRISYFYCFENPQQDNRVHHTMWLQILRKTMTANIYGTHLHVMPSSTNGL